MGAQFSQVGAPFAVCAQLSVDNFIVRLADTTTRDYLLNNCACRSLF